MIYQHTVHTDWHFYLLLKYFVKLTKTGLLLQHGEPGAAVADLQPVDVIVSHVLKQILSPVYPHTF